MDGKELKRAILSFLQHRQGSTIKEIGDAIGVDYGTVAEFVRNNNGVSVKPGRDRQWFLHERVVRHQAHQSQIDATPTNDASDAANVKYGSEHSSQPEELIASVLESLRKRLLNLTSRNRLLNFRHPKTGSVRVIDELPDQLKAFLVDDEKQMRFIPVPDPTREQLIEAGHIEVDPETGEDKLLHSPDANEWAKWLSLDTNYEAPDADSGDEADKHTDNAIQTMFFPDELETRLRSMRQKANSAIEETGANILFLALGFLEWTEHRDAEAKRLAPLYMIPVRLDRGKLNAATRTYEYRLKYSGEDILTNISLREKLRNDFHIALPELEDGVDPEAYIKDVAKAVRTREPNWKTRRFVTLCHLNFSKQLLYLDLDPDNWPSREALLSHPLVQQCLAGLEEEDKDNSDGLEFGEEHPIDDIKAIHEKYPLIDDADSSQHSALIDAIDGNNLVIEGPPGTGKSQTITNLIAAAIANNKKVLFVAEKMAALEVVKRRLDQAGLGAFCLELHSHTSQKRRVLDDLSERIKLKKRLRKPTEIDSDIARYESLKQQLREHAERINSEWKQTGSTIHQLFATATRFRQQLSIDPTLIHPDEISGESFTPAEKKTVLGQAQTFSTVYQGILDQLGDVDRISQHPWCGIRNTDLQAFEQQRIVDLLKEWETAVKSLQAAIDSFAESMDAVPEAFPQNLTDVRRLAERIRMIPEFDGQEPIRVMPRLRAERAAEFSAGLQLYKVIQLLFDDLAQYIHPDALQVRDTRQSLIESVEHLTSLARKDLSLSAIGADIAVLNTVTEAVRELAEPVQQTNQSLGLTGNKAMRLSMAGINDFVALAELVTSLPAEDFGYRDDVFDQDELDPVLPELFSTLETLIDEQEELGQVFDLTSLASLTRLHEIQKEYRQAGALRWLSGSWRRARKDLKSIRASTSVRLGSARNELHRLIEYVEQKQAFENNQRYQSLLGEHFQGLATNAKRISSLRTWYRRIRREYGAGFGTKVAVGNAIIDVDTGLARSLRSLVKSGLHQRAEQIRSGLEQLSANYPDVPGLAEESASLHGDACPIGHLSQEIPTHYSTLEEAGLEEGLPIIDIGRIGQKLKKQDSYLKKWNSLDFTKAYFDDQVQLPIGVGQTNESIVRQLERLSTFGELLASDALPEVIAEKVYSEPTLSTVGLIKSQNHQLQEALQKEAATFGEFEAAVQLDHSAWLSDDSPKLNTVRNRIAKALENPHWLASWLEYLRVTQALRDMGWSSVVTAVEQKRIEPEDIDAAVLLGASDQLSREILRETPSLSTFSGLTQQGIQEQFQQYDDKLRELQRERIAWKASRTSPPRGVSSGPIKKWTELALLKNEIGKKMRHIPLRQLIKRSGRTISALKPCFMMGPMSVAQYLEPGNLHFDLIVMDEASQVRPEDALGAVARGGQLVVVGDPKQLPPTSFFDKLLDGPDDDEEITAGEQSESILDAALTTFPARRLRWHYRSQHESLIAFSNHEFYGSDLVIFPSPVNEAPEYGIQYTRVTRGRFVNRVNREEAELIAKAVRKHMLTRPSESIGVVAMNAQQREQIERAIEQETKEDSRFRDLIDQDQSGTEPLFVKNLENVQGDERDVIYISMTYGPTEVGGKVAQRFGPINSANGWRRLNVLFTRSKKRMHVFTSMGSDDIIVSESSSRGVKSLKAFLDYAQNGRLSGTGEITGRDPDSDFEVAVAQALSNHGFECQPQVGVAGYFLDIAVRDPGNPGRYLMAIECDGATYHSAKSTRDRDRLRQRVLERLGWRIRRIWSTDWFNNPAGQLRPIIEELNQLKTTPSVELPPGNDEVEDIEEIADDIESDSEFVATIVRAGTDLKSRLEEFDKEYIRPKHPNTAPERRFLRPAMIAALVQHMPTTMSEFQAQIPPYLRHGTEPKEGEFIKPVLELIYESEL